jgi:hypothetical protein
MCAVLLPPGVNPIAVKQIIIIIIIITSTVRQSRPDLGYGATQNYV